jgi:predicted SnoaL-like aldol condensation-catalyzing enzyme
MVAVRDQRAQSPKTIAEVLVQAAKAVGPDGRGKDRLVGYFTRLARCDPKSFCPLLLDVLAARGMTPEDTEPEVIHYKTFEELEAAIRQRYPRARVSRVPNWQKPAEEPASEQGHHEEKSITIPEAVVLAAKAVGEDGRGKDGLVGYFKHITRRHPKSFARLGRMLVLQMSNAVEEVKPYRTSEEIRAELRRKYGISIEFSPRLCGTPYPPEDGGSFYQ